MAKKVKAAVKKTAKKVVKKVLDSTTIDEKIMENIDENRSLYNLILCYIKCYGGYVMAVGAGCLFGVNTIAGLSFLLGAAAWAYIITCACKPCKGGNTGSCCK
tara:strand:+ start:346 stop:654 length:309 start_codon:yes stop_codon:yes gene_type:complete